MEMIDAQPFEKMSDHGGHNQLLLLGDVIGNGGSAIVTECRCDGALGESSIVAKIYKASCDPNEPPEVAFQEATMLQAAASQHVASCLGLYHFDADSAAERLPAVQNFSHFSHLNGHFTKGPSKSTRSSSRSRGSTRSCRSSQETKPSSDEPKPSRLCALLMERLDYSLHDLTVFSFLESEAAFACHALLRGLCHLHSLGIIHRDVKPGNILIANGGNRIVLSDLGLAAWIPEGSRSVSRKACGTRGFVAPECLLKDECSKESDMFAVGAVLYQLLFGTYAFVRGSPAETDAAILQGKLPLEPCGEAVGRSTASCVLVRNLLDFDPTCRLTAEEALRCPWFQNQESLAALHNLREEAKTIKDETALRLFMEEKANSTYRRQVTKEARSKKTTGQKATWASRIVKVARRGLALRIGIRSKKVAPEPQDFDFIGPGKVG